jgi:hypothetical protein
MHRESEITQMHENISFTGHLTGCSLLLTK